MSRRKSYKRYLDPSEPNNLYDEPRIPKSTLHSRKKRKLQGETSKNDSDTGPSNSRNENESFAEPCDNDKLSSIGSTIQQRLSQNDIDSDHDNFILHEPQDSIIPFEQETSQSDSSSDSWYQGSEEDVPCNISETTNEDRHNSSPGGNEEHRSISGLDSEENTSEDSSLLTDDSNVHELSAVNEEETFSGEELCATASDIPNDNSNHEHDPYLSETLCPCTNTTRGEAIMMAILLGLEHSLTWVAITSILNLVNSLYERDVVPATKHRLFKYFQHDVNAFKYHVYCEVCNTYAGERNSLNHGETICRNCGLLFDAKTMESNFFLTLNFRSQLEKLLKNPEVQGSLDYKVKRKKKTTGNYEDLYDGNMYTKFSNMNKARSEEWNLSYTFNTDGCQAAESSKTTIWPIYVMLNELPMKLRSKYMLLVGLWVDEKEPDMKTFLRPFIDEANSLSTDGVEWTRNGEIILSRVFPLCCCVDSVARCSMLNMKRFNGTYGCTFCHHPTESVEGFRKYTVSIDVPTGRTDESIRADMCAAYESNEAVRGVWGPSALMNLNYFDLANGMTPDYMHSVLLGVIKQHTEIILTSTNTDYYMGSPNERAVINRRLLSAEIPKCITRTPRKIEDRKMWKASEWRSWLIWYALVCLRGIIGKKYIHHLALLVSALNIFLQDSISVQMVEHAEQLLIRYVVLFQRYFGKHTMTYNVHLLIHITNSVKNWGPLWAHNAFAFENENRLLINMKKSPRHVAVQIARRFLFYKSLPEFYQKFPIGPRFIEFCEDKDQVKFYLRVENALLIGSGNAGTLSAEEENCSGYSGNCIRYKKMISNNIRYTTESYGHSLKTNDSIIVTKQNVRGIITSICKIVFRGQQTVVIFFRKIMCETAPFIAGRHFKINHINVCHVNDGELQHCSPENLSGQCIIMKANKQFFIATVPYGCRGD